MTTDETSREARQYYWYHCVDLGNGAVTDGDYDLRTVLGAYGFPERMDGLRVLDVGRGSGFFSFEFERRGADVTATDLPSFLDWDFVGGERRKEEMRQAIGDEAAFTRRHITGAFDFAHRVRRSRVRGRLINVYDLEPAAFENTRFDLVFAGSVTSHLRDPALALERLHSVTQGVCVVAAPVVNLGCGSQPVVALVGTADSDRRSWWVMNGPGIVELMRCANFTDVRIVSRIDLVSRALGKVVPHVVVHARAASPSGPLNQRIRQATDPRQEAVTSGQSFQDDDRLLQLRECQQALRESEQRLEGAERRLRESQQKYGELEAGCRHYQQRLKRRPVRLAEWAADRLRFRRAS